MNAGRQRDRRPEELDEVVAQLNNLGGLGPVHGGTDGRGIGGAGERDPDVESRPPPPPLIMDDDDDDVAPAPDGTLLASTPARPL